MSPVTINVAPPWASYLSTNGLEAAPSRIGGNGILYLAELLALLDLRDDTRLQSFAASVVGRLTVEPGLYNRHATDWLLPTDRRPENSHDNLTGIAAAAALCQQPWAADLVDYGFAHGFLYRNSTSKPWIWYWMLPGNWGLWAALAGTHRWLQILTWPITAINLWLATRTPADQVGRKLLAFVALYPLRSHPLYGVLWRWFRRRMRRTYGILWLGRLFAIYFTDPQHPNRVLSAGVPL
jgi:hypothetical protein